MREDWDGEPVRKLRSGAQMIAIGHDDSADRIGVEQLTECSIGQAELDRQENVRCE